MSVFSKSLIFSIILLNFSAVAQAMQPKQKGEITCSEIALPPSPKKIICDYMPQFVTASELQTRILKQFSGGRQFPDPDMAYASVLNNGQLEFAHTDPNVINLIKQKLNDYDALDTHVIQRKVNLGIRIVQLVNNADQNLGFMVTKATYAGTHGNDMGKNDRFSLAQGIGSIINPTFAIGNLVNSLLEIALTDFESKKDIKVLSTVPLYGLKHGQSFSYDPYKQSQFIQTTSVTAEKETIGINISGQTRFYENANSKILVKDFTATVSQPMPLAASDSKDLRGVENFKVGPMDLELEVGCATAIRDLTVAQRIKEKTRNFFFSSGTNETETSKDFLFIVQALDDGSGQANVPSQCSQTVVKESIPDRL